MAIIKKVIEQGANVATSFAAALSEVAVPGYFSSVVAHTDTNPPSVDCYMTVDGEEKLAMSFKFVTSVTTKNSVVVYGLGTVSATYNDNVAYGKWHSIYAGDHGIVFTSDTYGTLGSTMMLTKDANGDVVFACTNMFQSVATTARDMYVTFNGQSAYTAVRPCKSAQMGQGAGPGRSSYTNSPLTTMVPLVLTDGTTGYCDKTFLVVNSQYTTTGELVLDGVSYLYTTNLASVIE